MNIYFAGSMRGGKQDVHLYAKIIEYLKKYGTVLTEFVGKENVLSEGGEGRTDQQIHEYDMSLLKTADVLVAEVTNTSLGVGYELGRAVAMDMKWILVLYRPKDAQRMISAMVRGFCNEKNYIYAEYCQENFQDTIDKFFSTLTQ